MDTKVMYRHRHLVALPMFLGALWVTSLTGSANALPAEVTPKTLSGEYSRLQAVQRVDYGAGKQLISTPGLLKTKVLDFEILALDGAFWLGEGKESVTVAALTAPVLVQGEDLLTVVPIGSQWQSAQGEGKLYAIPSSFAKRHLNDVYALPKIEANEVLPETTAHLPEAATAWQGLTLKKAHLAKQRQLKEQRLAYARYLLEQREPSEMALYLESDTSLQASDLSLLLNSYASDQVTVMPIVQKLAQENDRWLLLSLHPNYRDLAWQLEAEDRPNKWQLARLKTMPASLTSTATPSDLVLDRWQEQLLKISQLAPQKPVFIHGLTAQLTESIKKLERLGYPRRAQRLQVALSEVHGNLPAFVRKDSKKLLASLIQPTPVEPVKVEKKEVENESGLTPDQIEALANDLLEKLGVFRTVETSVTAVSSTRAQATQIAVPVVTDIKLLDFVIKVTAPQHIEQITLDGQTFPNAMTVEGFKAWVKTL